MAEKLYTITAHTENTPGILHRITVSFTKRKINVETLTVSETTKKGMSVFTIGVKVDSGLIHTIVKQLKRIVEVHEVYASEDKHLIHKEIAFVKLRLDSTDELNKIDELAKRYDSKLVYNDSDSAIIEFTGTADEVNSLYNLFESHDVLEFVRSGRIAMRKNTQTLMEDEFKA